MLRMLSAKHYCEACGRKLKQGKEIGVWVCKKCNKEYRLFTPNEELKKELERLAFRDNS